MGEYVMNSPMISIPMGVADVVLGIQWLQSLRTMAFNFQELFMKFSLEGKEIKLRGMTRKPGKVIVELQIYHMNKHLIVNLGR
jgi:hypothetical protein